ncbi:MAG TPA: phospholipase D-like domain-containing protein [Dongiaceae bacterium]
MFHLSVFGGLLHIGLSGAVTVHVLLRKRDVRSSTAWIGLAWLSPGFGALLYYVFGINRVMRRTSRMVRGTTPRKDMVTWKPAGPDSKPLAPEILGLPENIAAIARVSQVASHHMLAPGNAMTILQAGDEGFPAMLEEIGKAKRSVALASYIFHADKAGLAFVAACKQAQDRGVEVRVLIDGVGCGYLRSPIAERFAAVGIRTERFMHYWQPWRMPFVNMRIHKKLLIVDGTVGFTGGLNISAQCILNDDPVDPVNDVHFRFEGPIVTQLMVTFAEDWNFMTGEVLDGEAWWPELAPAGVIPARGISSGPDEDIGVLSSILATAIGEAKRRLRIVTPYFLPDQTLAATLVIAALRGVEVDIVVPLLSDHPSLNWAMHAHLSYLTVPGINIYYANPPFDHSKLVTVDGAWSLIGSANWDVRSLRLNFEFNVECYGTRAAAEIDKVIDAKIAASRKVQPDEFANRTLPFKLRDAAARLLLPYI